MSDEAHGPGGSHAPFLRWHPFGREVHLRCRLCGWTKRVPRSEVTFKRPRAEGVMG